MRRIYKAWRVRVSRRITAQIIIDVALIIGATTSAFVLSHDQAALPASDIAARQAVVRSLMPLLLFLRVAALYALHLYRVYWRYMSISDLWVVAKATTVSSGLFYLFLLLTGRGGPGVYSWRLQLLDWGMNVFLLSGIRVCYRHISDRSLFKRAPDTPRRDARRAVVVGAGDSGEAVVRELLRRPQDGVKPVGFVDDDPNKRRIRIHGLPVLGTTHEIEEVAHRVGAEMILIAIPNAPGKAIRELLARCERTNARLYIVPTLPEVLGATKTGSNRPVLSRTPAQTRLRDINIEDLLRREPVCTDTEGVSSYLHNRCVMVTGAGGSIGSELCRQIAQLAPERLVLVGRGENSIFEIEQELIREHGFTPLSIIADIKDRERMAAIFEAERPNVVFHAAAHKHVPLMEQNPQEAVKNNVLGTLNLAELSVEHGIERFIYVSSDKAVNPSSVMGATKRIGEMIVQSMAAQTDTGFAAVRFGNVLGSRGSVVPMMCKQIARGGPVTVTDPRMTRYFMTIPEAVQLILQAGAIGTRGEVYILDMGEPVRIVDLANDLIRLSGLRPNVDVTIEFTGVRPGEKIFEELHYDQEERGRTAHEKIFVSEAGEPPRATLNRVRRLIDLSQTDNGEGLRAEVMILAGSGFTGPGEPRPKTE